MNVVRVCVCELKICALEKKKSCAQNKNFYTHSVILRLRAKNLLPAFVVARAMVRERTTTNKSCSLLKSVHEKTFIKKVSGRSFVRNWKTLPHYGNALKHTLRGPWPNE